MIIIITVYLVFLLKVEKKMTLFLVGKKSSQRLAAIRSEAIGSQFAPSFPSFPPPSQSIAINLFKVLARNSLWLLKKPIYALLLTEKKPEFGK